MSLGRVLRLVQAPGIALTLLMRIDPPNERPPLRVPFPEVIVVLGDPRLPDATKVDARYSAEDLEAVVRMKAALSQLHDYRFTYLDDHERLMEQLAADPPAFVLNLCDTGFRNVATRELHVPALLEMFEIPYTGATPACLAYCYDKGCVHAIAAACGVPVPMQVFVPSCDLKADLHCDFPALVKPNTGDGSVGITCGSVVENDGEARRYLEQLRRELPGRDALVQEFLPGPEYAVALIGNTSDRFTVLPLLEVDYSGLDPGLPRILSYESKTVPDSPYWRQLRYRQAELPVDELQSLVRCAEVLFERLGCRDYARFDFRTATDGNAKLLEVNPNPAWCWDGKLQLMTNFAGGTEADLFRMILEAAQKREDARMGVSSR